MERELIFAAKTRKLGKKQIMQEIEIIKKMFPYADSFESFKISNEVFDISRHKTINNIFRLHNIFKKGTDKNVSYFVICKN